MNLKKTQLTLCLALTVLTALTACGDAEDKNTADDSSAATTAAVSTAETESDRPQCKLPADLNFDGAAFRTLTFSWQGYQYYFFAEEETGDVMNDALCTRTRAIEERLNVDLQYNMLNQIETGAVTNEVKPLIMAGDDVYQQLLFHCIDGISAFSSTDLLYNLDTLPYIDTDADWWNKEQMETLRLGQNTYFAVNDYMLPAPYIVFFSKDLVESLDYEDPYQLVYNGTWTLDVFLEMARGVVADLDGNGKMEAEHDRYGVTATEISKYISFVTGANQFITEKDEDGRMALAINTEKTQTIMERFSDMAKEDVFYIPPAEHEGYHLTLDSGRLLFDLEALTWAEKMRDYTADFGFLPYPKYDEAQTSYRSLDWGGLMGVPASITDPALVGAVLELQAYESASDVIPTYYDTVLTGKLARDEDAVKMLDIVFDTICYEPGGNYFGFASGFYDLFFALPNLAIKEKSAEFASYYKKAEKPATRTIRDFYEALDNTESN